jgi:putative transposase
MESGCINHELMYVSIQPKLSVSKAVGLIKGKSALMIFNRHPEYWEKGNRHFWARGYYCGTVGNVNTGLQLLKFPKT